jgi:excisionase family DNA binding protein
MSREHVAGSSQLLLTVNQAAARLGLGKTKVYELMMRGELASVRVGAARRIPTRALEEYERLMAAQLKEPGQ